MMSSEVDVRYLCIYELSEDDFCTYDMGQK